MANGTDGKKGTIRPSTSGASFFFQSFASYRVGRRTRTGEPHVLDLNPGLRSPAVSFEQVTDVPKPRFLPFKMGTTTSSTSLRGLFAELTVIMQRRVLCILACRLAHTERRCPVSGHCYHLLYSPLGSSTRGGGASDAHLTLSEAHGKWRSRLHVFCVLACLCSALPLIKQWV